MGYLEQPHASAGRVPSELGYRFYVDSLLEHYAMTAHEVAQINRLLQAKMGELDQILQAASSLASNLTNYTGIAIKPRVCSVSINKFDIIYLEPNHYILVAVTQAPSYTLPSRVYTLTFSHSPFSALIPPRLVILSLPLDLSSATIPPRVSV